MKFDTAARNLKVLLRADSIIADLHLKALLARSGLYAFAGLVAAFGLVMVGIGIFFALSEIWGPVWAAVAVGLGNVVLALIVALVAGAVKPGHDLDFAQEIHRSAMEALVVEVKGMEGEVRGIANFMRHPLDNALPGILSTVLGLVLGALRNRDKT